MNSTSRPIPSKAINKENVSLVSPAYLVSCQDHRHLQLPRNLMPTCVKNWLLQKELKNSFTLVHI